MQRINSSKNRTVSESGFLLAALSSNLLYSIDSTNVTPTES